MKASIISLLVLSGMAQAQMVSVDPLNYQFDAQTDAGSYPYHDWTGEQLTDGAFGEGLWSNDLGNGNAYEWVGWTDPLVNIDFNFEGVRTFNSIVLSTYHGTGGVTLPSWSVYAWLNNSWVLQADQANVVPEDRTLQGVDLSLNDLLFSTERVRISVRHSDQGGPWSFVDEISFYQTPQYATFDQQFNQQMAASDVSTMGAGMMSLLGVVMMAGGRRRKREK